MKLTFQNKWRIEKAPVWLKVKSKRSSSNLMKRTSRWIGSLIMKERMCFGSNLISNWLRIGPFWLIKFLQFCVQTVPWFSYLLALIDGWIWKKFLIHKTSDPDPLDPHVFWPPGSRSTCQRYGSGSTSGSRSFYHHTKTIRKILNPTILWLFLTFYLWKIM